MLQEFSERLSAMGIYEFYMKFLNNIHYICIIMHIDTGELLVYISKVEKRG